MIPFVLCFLLCFSFFMNSTRSSCCCLSSSVLQMKIKHSRKNKYKCGVQKEMLICYFFHSLQLLDKQEWCICFEMNCDVIGYKIVKKFNFYLIWSYIWIFHTWSSWRNKTIQAKLRDKRIVWQKQLVKRILLYKIKVKASSCFFLQYYQRLECIAFEGQGN